MRRCFFLVLCMLSCCVVGAEDIIQVVPFQAAAGVTSDDAQYFSVSLSNAHDIVGFQFDIYLPEGMAFDELYDPIELNDERVPNTKGRGGAITWKMGITMADKGNGHYFVMLAANGGMPEPFAGHEGEVMKIYYTTTADFQAGIHPIVLRDVVFALDGVHGLEPGTSSSYCWVGDAPVETDAASADLSSLEGYLPSFVVESLNDQLAGCTSLTGVDLSQADSLGTALSLANSNAVVVAKAGSEVAALPNAVTRGAGGESVCQRLQLHDGNNDFNAAFAFTAQEASYDREYQEEYWSTVCLPFALSAEQVADIKDKGVSIEKLSGYDAAAARVTFAAVDEMEPNTPYLVKSLTTQTPFDDLGEVAVSASATTTDVTVGAMSMQGSFIHRTINSDDNTVYFAYDEADGQFVRIGQRGIVKPFRAWLALSEASGAKRLDVAHDGETTAVQPTELTDPSAGSVSPEAVVVYDLQGRRLDGVSQQGLVIVNGKKVVNKAARR